jgi:hypothetical protein
MEFYDFPFSWEFHQIPTGEVIFFRRAGIPPTSDGVTQQLTTGGHHILEKGCIDI